MVDIHQIKDLELLRLEIEYWRKQHFALTEEIRTLRELLGMSEDITRIVYKHSGGRPPSPVESRDIRIVLSKNKDNRE